MPQHSDGHPSALLRSRQRSPPLGHPRVPAVPGTSQRIYRSRDRAVGRSRSSWAGYADHFQTSASLPPRSATNSTRDGPSGFHSPNFGYFILDQASGVHSPAVVANRSWSARGHEAARHFLNTSTGRGQIGSCAAGVALLQVEARVARTSAVEQADAAPAAGNRSGNGSPMERVCAIQELRALTPWCHSVFGWPPR